MITESHSPEATRYESLQLADVGALTLTVTWKFPLASKSPSALVDAKQGDEKLSGTLGGAFPMNSGIHRQYGPGSGLCCGDFSEAVARACASSHDDGQCFIGDSNAIELGHEKVEKKVLGGAEVEPYPKTREPSHQFP